MMYTSEYVSISREIPADMKLPNGMNYEEFKEKIQKDMEKGFGSIKSACRAHFHLTETDLKPIDYMQRSMKTTLSSEVALKELFWDMCQKAAANKKTGGEVNDC